jgi:hypothetical protein
MSRGGWSTVCPARRSGRANSDTRDSAAGLHCQLAMCGCTPLPPQQCTHLSVTLWWLGRPQRCRSTSPWPRAVPAAPQVRFIKDCRQQAHSTSTTAERVRPSGTQPQHCACALCWAELAALDQLLASRGPHFGGCGVLSYTVAQHVLGQNVE